MHFWSIPSMLLGSQSCGIRRLLVGRDVDGVRAASGSLSDVWRLHYRRKSVFDLIGGTNAFIGCRCRTSQADGWSTAYTFPALSGRRFEHRLQFISGKSLIRNSSYSRVRAYDSGRRRKPRKRLTSISFKRKCATGGVWLAQQPHVGVRRMLLALSSCYW